MPMNVAEMVQAGRYETKTPFAHPEFDPWAYRAHIRDQERLHAELKRDLEREHHIEKNPRRDKLWKFAFDRGIPNGLNHVVARYEDALPLIRD